jgi:hypothetical protein
MLISCVLTLLLIQTAGCSTASRTDRDLIARRGGSTLGLVVFGEDDAQRPEQRSARYLIEPGGLFRASFGGGSDALTYPPITRRLSETQVEVIWSLIDQMQVAQSPWEPVMAPELYHPQDRDSRMYLLEVSDAHSSGAWSVPVSNENARVLAMRLAELAWVTD